MLHQNLINGVPLEVNGHRVIQVTNSKKLKLSQYTDLPSLFNWYQEDPMTNQLGLIDLYSNAMDFRVPMYTEIFRNRQILEVNGVNGTLSYDLPVYKDGGVYTTEDTSDFSNVPGIDGSVFPIVLDAPYTVGDVLTYNKMGGMQVIVSEDYPVENQGDSYKHWVKLNGLDAGKWFPSEKLKPGIQYFKTGHAMHENSVHYSGIESPRNVGTITCEFQLGNHRGVETSWTMYADKKSFGALEVKAAEIFQGVVNDYIEQVPGDMFIMGNIAPGSAPNAPSISSRGASVGSVMEFFALAEYFKIEANQLLFQRAGGINEINGYKVLNEGLWYQWRRGRLIKYAKPSGITVNHIREAAAYIFAANRNMPIQDRRIKFKCGYHAYQNMLAIFQDYVVANITGLGLFNGADRLLPQSPVSGALNNLKVAPVVFTEVPIPGVGVVQIEHDPSLDFMLGSDRFSQGFNDLGYADTSYSMVIYDASSSEYSNARTNLPAGTKLIDGGKKGSTYYVKPEGDNMYWGYENGRYAGSKATDIVSSLKTMARSFWVHGMSAFVNVDPSRTVIIELQKVGID